MNVLGSLLIFVLFFVLCGCSEKDFSSDSQDADYLESLNLNDFSLIRSKGKSVSLGTNDSMAAISARPMMESRFDYDFWIGNHEVTCKEMGLSCADSLPATDVTFFDAILYSNRRSVAEGFDSAYSYTSAVFDNGGSCVGLEGLVFRPEVNAYRLPTEAEWIYAASLDWNPDNSWNSQNSGYELHPVCSAKVGENGFCDMAGNAAEWVNDLKVRFRSEGVNDFVGGKVVTGLEERVVKGGSFRNAPSSMNLHNRGDVYTVTSSTKADYVGFRLAFGAIPNPTFLNSEGSQNVVGYSLLANSRTVNDFVGAQHSKLVFRDGETERLVFVNFDGAIRSVVDAKVSGGYHPDISPDGKFVAYTTGMEGISGNAKVYVRSLGESGNEQILPVESAAIPRWRVLENGDTALVYVTDAGSNKGEADFLQQGTWQVDFSGTRAPGYFGEPEKLFAGAYHGGVSRNGNLAVTGSTLLRARVNGKDDVWYDGLQACNVSLSHGGANKVLFLDFGGKTGREFVGESYGVHERALVADSAGKLVMAIAPPKGYTFDHTEWIAGSDSIFVATLVDVNGNHRKIVLVNVNSGDVLPLVEGEDLLHPALWTGKRSSESSWDYDSLGVYRAEEGQYFQIIAQKIPLLWKYKDSAEVVCLGNSHMIQSVMPLNMSLSTINMGTIPCDMHCIEFLYEGYVSAQAKALKYLIIGLDIDLWTEYDSEGAIQVNFGDAAGFQYDMHHQYWRDGVDSLFLKRVEEIALAKTEFVKMRENRGWSSHECVPDWGSQGTGLVEIQEDSTAFDDGARYESNYSKLLQVLDIAKKQNVVVVGVVFPVSPYYRNTGSYSRHGMRRSMAEKMIERFKKLAEENENFVLMDENKMGNHDYLGNVACDFDHLCVEGAKKLTSRLDSLLKSLEKR